MDFVNANNNWGEIVCEDFPQNTSVLTAREYCLRLREHLNYSSGQLGVFRSINRWLRDTSLGTLEQMRIELEIRFKTEQVVVESFDKKLIDCVWIPSVDGVENSPVMVICNDNRDYYEFSYYSSMWVEFYLTAGVSLLLWNYRGTGRSKGRFNVTNSKKDGECIIEYLRNVKKIERLGVHGEGLGGHIAIHMAKHSHLDFLVVDRSFFSVEQFVHYNYSVGIYLLYKCFNWKSEDVSQDFIEIDCYKIIFTDCSDAAFNDLASLKSGVALRILGEDACFDRKKAVHLLTAEEITSFYEAYTPLMKMIVKNTIKKEVQLSISSNPRLKKMSEDSKTYFVFDGTIDEESVINLLCQIFTVLERVDAAGKSLCYVYIDKPRMPSLKLWLIALDVYGSFLPLLHDEIGNSRLKALNKLDESAAELERIVNSYRNHQNEFVKRILSYTDTLKTHFNTLYQLFQREIFDAPPSEESNSELNNGFLHKYELNKVGFLVPLNTVQDHGNLEKQYYEAHLYKSMFLG